MSHMEIKPKATYLLPSTCSYCNRKASYTAWIIGRPLVQTCQRHRATVRETWDGALDQGHPSAVGEAV